MGDNWVFLRRSETQRMLILIPYLVFHPNTLIIFTRLTVPHCYLSILLFLTMWPFMKKQILLQKRPVTLGDLEWFISQTLASISFWRLGIQSFHPKEDLLCWHGVVHINSEGLQRLLTENAHVIFRCPENADQHLRHAHWWQIRAKRIVTITIICHILLMPVLKPVIGSSAKIIRLQMFQTWHSC